jgi:hypothetical protein
MSLPNIFGIHQKIADDLCRDEVHGLRCLACQSYRVISVEEFAEYLAHGWPKCCGSTMQLEKQ